MGQFRTFQGIIQVLMQADNAISLFEFATLRLLMRHLGPQFGVRRKPRVRYHSADSILQPTAILLSTLARVGAPEGGPAVQEAFDAGSRSLPWKGRVQFVRDDQRGLESVHTALEVLEECSPTLKRDLLKACASTVGADGVVTVEEGELLRAIADSLDCPMPPILGEVVSS